MSSQLGSQIFINSRPKVPLIYNALSDAEKKIIDDKIKADDAAVIAAATTAGAPTTNPASLPTYGAAGTTPTTTQVCSIRVRLPKLQIDKG